MSASATGVDAKMPEKVGCAVNPKRQRSSKRATLPASIVDPAAARVPSRSLFGSCQTASSPPPPQAQSRHANNAEAAASGAIRDGIEAKSGATLSPRDSCLLTLGLLA